MSNTTYFLGTAGANGSLYFFTGMGEFKTPAAARAYAESSPRNGNVLVIKHIDKGWGVDYEVMP